jgi:general stress protein 26
MAKKPAQDEARPIPQATPIALSAGYTPPGTKQKLLSWTFAETRLRRAHNYWVCSTRSDARPHAVPVWAVWLNAALYFSTDPSSRKARNLSANPATTIHLESGDEVVTLEGSATPCELTQAIDAAYFRKYKIHLIGFPAPMVLLRVAPDLVMAWREKQFPASATRWKFA